MDSTRSSKRRRKNQTAEESTKVDAALPSKPVCAEKSPVVVFAHGAGAPSSSEWMITWKTKLATALSAAESDLSGGKKKAPPKAEKLVDFHLDIVKQAMDKFPGHPLILAGKSMGSRVSCMVAGKNDTVVSAVVCLGYPLKGMNGAIRDEPLLQLKVPVMFVQGSKDALCPLVKLEAVGKKMKCMNEIHVVDGGDHSFKIGKKHLQANGTTQTEAEDLAVQAIAAFASRSLG